MKNIAIILSLMLLLPISLCAWTNYKSVSTPGFAVYYRDGWETEALNVLQVMEYYRPYVEKLTGNNLGRIPIVIEDMGNLVNGYTNPVGIKIALFAYPPTSDILSMGEDWWQMVGVHEYIHMAQMTKTGGFPALVRAIFGNVFYPNLLQPMWMTEAITVYGESQLSDFSGRMKGGTYPSIISALAREGKLPSVAKAGIYSYDTPLGNYYVFGGSFFTYLSKTYGEEKFAQLFELQGSSLETYLSPLTPMLSIDRYFSQVYGVPLQDLWYQWQASEAQKSYRLPTNQITDHGWNTGNLKHDGGALYYTSFKVDKTGPFSGFSSHRIMRLVDLGDYAEPQVLIDQRTDFPAGYQVNGNMLYYSRSEMRRGFDNNDNDGFGAITEIWSLDMDSGKRSRLFEGSIRAFCKLDDGTFLIATDDATYQKNTLSLHSASGAFIRNIGTLDHLIANIVSDGGRIYVSARKYWQNNSIYELDLAGGNLKPIIDTPHLENLVSVNGDRLVFDAVYEGKNGSYLYDLRTKLIYRMGEFTETKTPATTRDGKTYFISMNAYGEDIYQETLDLIPYSPPLVKKNPPPFPRLDAKDASLVLDKYPIQRGGYAANIAHMLWPRLYRLPYIEGSETNADSLAIGIQMAGSDILGDFPMWDATLIYDTYAKKIGYAVGIENYFFRPLMHSLRFKDLNGKSFTSSQYIPLLKRSNYGLNDVWAGFGFATSDGLDRKLWYPFLGANLSWNGGRLQTSNALMYETQDFFGSDRDRLGWQGRFSFRQKTPLTSEIRSNIHIAYDPDADTDEVFSTIRGYDSNWDHNKGLSINNTWYKPIIQIREGLWNPLIYMEDINLGLFYDASIPADRSKENTRYATGVELISEISAGFRFTFDLGIRFSYNKDKEVMTQLILGSNF